MAKIEKMCKSYSKIILNTNYSVFHFLFIVRLQYHLPYHRFNFAKVRMFSNVPRQSIPLLVSLICSCN